MYQSKKIAVLGGGPAGLATAYYAKKKGLKATVFEAESEIGGNCRTLSHGEFLFDTGAHRFHDKDPEITQEVSGLMGEDFLKISKPSKIFFGGRYVQFPLSPLNVLSSLDVLTALRAGLEITEKMFHRNGRPLSFEDYVCGKYGKTLSRLFLLNYSEKLWGLPGSELSPVVAGKRLEGLNIRTIVAEMLFPKLRKGNHLEGDFYYPVGGIGALSERLGKECGSAAIRRRARITKIRHNGKAVTEIEINGRETVNPEHVVSTLPLKTLLELLDPLPESEIQELATMVRFRKLHLVVLFLNKDNVTNAASVYFPDKAFPFTRVYEPKNRCPSMAPVGKTSLVAEIPFSDAGRACAGSREDMIKTVLSHYQNIGWVGKDEVIGATVKTLPFAYPVFDREYQSRINTILDYLNTIQNLRVVGRNGQFVYTWFHNAMRFGKETVEDFC